MIISDNNVDKFFDLSSQEQHEILTEKLNKNSYFIDIDYNKSDNDFLFFLRRYKIEKTEKEILKNAKKHLRSKKLNRLIE